MKQAIGVISAVCLLSFPTLSFAHVQDQLVVDPPTPIVGNEVTITGGGWMPDGCWSPQYTYECAMEGNAITLTFHTTDDWNVGLACVLLIYPFSGTCALGALPMGTYTVHVVEIRDSLREPFPSVQNFEFDVQQAIATQRQRWSTLKGMFATASD